MILPSEALITHIDSLYTSRKEFAERIGIDESHLSRLMAGKRTATSFVIEAIQKTTGFDFEKAWVIKEGESEED